ncbi:unnamed protein product, partial [Rotaria sp. Silwood1]
MAKYLKKVLRSIFPREKPDADKWINIAVIGETGSGKSTFINTLTNYFLKGSLNNLKVAIPTRYSSATESFDHTEKDIDDVTKSKTDMCHHYTFEDDETGKYYLFIDTPGLNDTRGADQDALNIPKIRQAIADLGHLSAVILVISGSLCRLTAGMRNVLISLRGNLPDIVLDNVIVVLTNVQRHTSNFDLNCLEINGNIFPYYMQNSAFSKDPRRRTEEDMVSLKADWKDSMKEIKTMLQKINTFQAKSVAAFKDLENQRNIIKALMTEAKLEVTNIQKMQDEIASLQQALKKYGDDESMYQQYTQETVLDVKEIVDAEYHSTMCSKCDNVCHDRCSLNETTVVGHDIFQGCVAMREGQCTQCPLLCSWAEHFHARKTIQVKQQTVEKVLEDIKAKYDIATQVQANGTPSNVSISSLSTTAAITADQLDSMKIPDLLIKHTAYYQNRDLQNYLLAQKELENRASGKSLGPLTSNEQDSLFDFRTQFEKYDSASLSKEYITLQQTINRAIEVDIQQISKIPFTTLLKIAALYMLLQKHQQQRNTDNNNGAYNISQAQRVSPTQSMSSIGRESGTHTSPPNMTTLPKEFQTIHTSNTTEAPPIGFHGHITTDLLTNSFRNLSLSDESNGVLVSYYMDAVNFNNYVERNLISEELKHRLDGERFGRKTPEENTHYESLRSYYLSQSVQFVQQQYKHLHDTIGSYVQDVPARILDISSYDLLTLCVLYTLLPGNPPPYSTYSSSHHNTVYNSTSLRQNQPSTSRPIVSDLPNTFLSASPHQEFRNTPYNEIENATTTAFKQGNTTMTELLSLHDDYCRPAPSNKSSLIPQSTFERHCGEKTITLTKEGATIYDSEIDVYKPSTYEELKLIYSAMIKMRVQAKDDDADHIKKAAEQANIRAIAVLHLLKLKEKENENLD